jgi:hypothetical protein
LELEEQEFKILYKYLSNFYIDSLTARKRGLLNFLSSTLPSPKMLDILLSLALELPSTLHCKFGRNPPDPSKSLLGTLGEVLSPLLGGDRKEAIKVFARLPSDHQVILAPFLSGDILKIGKDHIFDTLVTFYPLNELLAEYITLATAPMEANKIAKSFNMSDYNSLTYPFYALSSKRLNSNNKKYFKLGYVAKQGDESIANTGLSKLVRKTLLEKVKVSGGYIFLYKKTAPSRYTIHIFIEADYKSIVDITKGKSVSLSKLSLGELINKPNSTKQCSISKRRLTEITCPEDLTKVVRHTSNPLILSDKGIGGLPLVKTNAYYKVVDFTLTEDYEVTGFVVEKEGKLIEVRGYITDELLEAGIGSLYVLLKTYKLGGDVILEEFISTFLGTITKCAMCGVLAKEPSRSTKHLCLKHNKEIIALAKSNCVKSFSIPMDNFTETPVTFNVNKYNVEVNKKEVKFTLREDVKGKQYSLPFDFVNDW